MSDFECCTPVCVNCYAEEADVECVFLDAEGQIVDEWSEHDFRTSHEGTDRELRVYEHGDAALYCMACDHYHAPDVDCSAVNGSGVGYVIDTGSCPSPDREDGSAER